MKALQECLEKVRRTEWSGVNGQRRKRASVVGLRAKADDTVDPPHLLSKRA